jgi:hypothetical protein
MADENYGHMTMIDGSHVPLTKEGAEAIWKSVEAAREKRAETLPNAQDALRGMIQAETRMRELGWSIGYGFKVKRGENCAVAQQGSTGMWSGFVDAEGDYVHFGDCVVDPRKAWLKPLAELTDDERALIKECDQREAEAFTAMISHMREVDEELSQPIPEGGDK